MNFGESILSVDFESANFIATELVSPAKVLSLLKADLGKDLQVEIENKQALSVPIQIFLPQYLGGYQKALNELKAFWLESADEILGLLPMNWRKIIQKIS